jgi:NAD(P)-dependent dehydrogenase (short-subunit alcohol dehydrogenase family)
MSIPDLFKLQGKKALVIGGGMGMGESSVRLLAEVGADVAVADLLLERAERVAGLVRSLGRKTAALAADVTDDAQAEALVAKAEQALGGLDVLVTIVGQALFTPLLEMTPDQWDWEQRRNLKHFFVTGKAAAASMVARKVGGAMVCIASVDGIQGAVHHAAYGAAKAGLMHLVKSMASEWAPYGIRVNAVVPGTISTPRMQQTEAMKEAVARSLLPTGRSGTTDDIGKAVLFLASDLASYTTGHSLLVDGGWMTANLFDARKATLNSNIEKA